MTHFAHRLIDWHRRHGRHDLPWQHDPAPYRVWVSEIMLQQTQVKTVIPYFNRFMQRFADIESLASTPLDEVLHQWTGLGYYARARNLHRAAQIIWQEYDGIFPEQIDELLALPGIGRSTAGAILALSRHQVHPILDGNVKRVLARYHEIEGWPGERLVEQQLWSLAAEHTPEKEVADYTQAIMDLGATVCTRSNPHCTDCPVNDDCRAFLQNLQTRIPGKKPRKAMPVRQVIFTIIENGRNEVLLQRRPPSGIWGGLWSFPECPVGLDVSDWVESELGLSVSQWQKQDRLQHTFSHFHLDILPLCGRLAADSAACVNDRDDLCWYKSGKLLGMAAPVSRLLNIRT